MDNWVDKNIYKCIKLLIIIDILGINGAQEKQVAFWKSKYYQWFISEPLKKAVLCPQSFYTIAITLQNSLFMCSSSVITSNADPERLDTRGPMGCMKRQ